jgi:[ribosomal protein S5]-alanine N-acetyltransferase
LAAQIKPARQANRQRDHRTGIPPEWPSLPWDHERMTASRLITPGDAPVLAELQRVNREYLAPFEPARSEGYFTEAGQLAVIEQALTEHEQGRNLPKVILDDGAGVVGRITLNGIVRGAFQSCSVGYWVSQSVSGRGLATAALREIIGVAFGELGLHRMQAETLLDNVASQRVLERNGFGRIGMAPSYLKIAGRWQDMILYQLINPSAI